jgi:phosphoribosylamine--glycine ligase
MESDLFEYLMGSVSGTLDIMSPISWKDKSAVCIVLASNGYPASYPKGDEIFGLDQTFEDGFVFHAGTKKQDGKIITNGGRVLGVTGLGDTLESAIKYAYEITEKISWENKYLRTDIGKKGLSYL